MDRQIQSNIGDVCCQVFLRWLRSIVDDRRYDASAAGLHPGGGAVGVGRVETGSCEGDAVLGGCNGEDGRQEEKGHLQGIRSSTE